MSKQLAFGYRTHGGARRNAGRKPLGATAGVSHLRRPALDARTPALVTLRVRRDVPNLRTERMMEALREAFAAGCRRFGFRLVHFAVLQNHLHFVVEAEGNTSLARGMQGLAIRVARAVNRVAGRSGGVMADRYHARPLGSPRQVRNALAYVLLNRQRHGFGRRVGFAGANVDPCSSAADFDGWTPGFTPRGAPRGATAAPRTWLLARGWRRHGAIDPRETPGPGG
jgi:REP-associated tyrosine transposase